MATLLDLLTNGTFCECFVSLAADDTFTLKKLVQIKTESLL